MLINERASSGADSSFIAKYGEFTVLTMLWIEWNQYVINSSIMITTEVKTLVENMRILKS
jgi:hypothetical protein